MPLTFKSIIADIFYTCTLATAGCLCILAASVYLSPRDTPYYTFYTQDTFLRIPHDRFPQLNESCSSLNNNVAYHQTHVTGPLTKALLDQMVAVKTQVHDTAVDLGCAEQKRMEHICYVLLVEEMRLGTDIITQRTEWYSDAEKEEVQRYIDAGMAEIERVVEALEAEMEEVKRYNNAKKEEVEREPLSEYEHGVWTTA